MLALGVVDDDVGIGSGRDDALASGQAKDPSGRRGRDLDPAFSGVAAGDHALEHQIDALLDAWEAVRDLAEVALAEVLLAHEVEGAVVGADGLQVLATLQATNGLPRALDLERDETGDWHAEIGELPAGMHTLNLQILGTSPAGQPLDQNLPPLPLESVPAPVSESARPAEEPPQPRFGWFAYSWQLAAVNGIALLLACALWWWRRRRRDRDAELRLAEVES